MQTQSQHSSIGSSLSAMQDQGDMVLEQDDRQERQEQQHESHTSMDVQNTDQPESKNDETECQSKDGADENRILRRGDLVRIVARYVEISIHAGCLPAFGVSHRSNSLRVSNC